MEPNDDDIEFDFFDDEPATAEAEPGRTRIPRPARRARGPIGPPRGTAPLLRLLALVVLVIALILIFALVLQSCSSSSKHDSYAGYMTKVGKIATLSTADGKLVATTLATPGLKVGDIVTKLRGIADQERQNVQAAQALDPPGRLREENGNLIEALQFRVNGVDGLAATFQSTATSKNNSTDANLLADQADRLLASDIVWDDLFRAPATTQMRHDGVSGVTVPESQFTSKDLITAHSMALVLQRIRGAATGGTVSGLHGTNIVSVSAEPAGQTLSTGSLNTVTASTDLSFVVAVKDSGDGQEVQIPVTLTISGGQSSITRTKTIQVINPGETVTVTFSGLGAVSIATQHTLQVDVKPVPGEANKTNNSASYPIILSLPGG
jgi:hypothetical protein